MVLLINVFEMKQFFRKLSVRQNLWVFLLLEVCWQVYSYPFIIC